MDRMDIFVNVMPVQVSELRDVSKGEDSETVRARVERAHAIQYARNGDGKLNVALTTDDIDRFCQMDNDASSFFDKAIEKLNLSARGYYRVLKVARTIADLDGGAEKLSKAHVAEAIALRHQSI